MKNIKHIIKVLLLLPIIMIIGCDDDYETPPSFTDLYITMTTANSSLRESEVNKFFSFSDVSAGVEYTEWRIPENCFFLQGPIPNNLNNHDAYIKQPISNISNDKTVSILFKKGNSDTRIGYYGIFKDSTSYIFNLRWDPTINASVPDTIKTVNINGKWIAEYYFSLDVYDTVVATPQVRELDGTIIDHINTASKTLSVGDRLVFEDLSALLDDNNARPQITRWRVRTPTGVTPQRTIYSSEFDRNNNFTRQIIDTITFDTAGDYKVDLTAIRNSTETVRQSRDTITIPMLFKVVP